MLKKLFFLFVTLLAFGSSRAQMTHNDSVRIAAKDSTLRALIHADSVKVDKEFAEREKWDKLEARAIYPVMKAGNFSGVIPVPEADEIPDPKIDYKLLFELTVNNPDSIASEINMGLMEVVRKINLHVASGIPLSKIYPVIVVHGDALNAIKTDSAYRKRYKMDNPNFKVIKDLERIGAKFIACGQAMNFSGTKKEDLLQGVRISLTAQTVLSHYQLKGYVLYALTQ